MQTIDEIRAQLDELQRQSTVSAQISEHLNAVRDIIKAEAVARVDRQGELLKLFEAAIGMQK